MENTVLFVILVRVLCVDAIIDSADTNSDWRLDFEEYKTLMDSSFQPKEKRELFETCFV